MKPPKWLPELTFLNAQWDEVVKLTKIYPNITEYDLAEDWQSFSALYLKNNPTVDWFKPLRLFRKTRLAYLAFHDLSEPIENHLKTMYLVADLADLLIQQAHHVATKYMLEKHGNVLNSEGQNVKFMIWALGKLGTRELNYSSDVDLVFLYSTDGQSDGDRPLDAASYFIRLGQKIIKLLDHFTEHGQVYRVDMRLRPFGSAGPLACSVSAFQQYLQYEGREWERFAWMRGRLVSGSVEQATKINEYMSPFIYRKHLDYAVFDALAKIKIEIADHLDYEDEDLKQGAGGIRAVEFIVQSLQLVFGGRNTLLQGVDISRQIDQLIVAGKFSTGEGQALKLAWLWLRKLENISQSVADQAVHVIPNNAVVQQVISESFGCHDWPEMQLLIKQNRQHVNRMFSQLFEQAENEQVMSIEQRQVLQPLMSEFSHKRLPVKRIENLEKLLQKTMQLGPQSVLMNFANLLKKILTRPNYILMLLKETNVHKSVINLMSNHDYFVSILQQYPVLLEQLFERQILAQYDMNSLKSNWQKQKYSDDEEWMEALRYFKLEHQFNLILAYCEKQISHQEVLKKMTQLAAFILSEVVQCAHQDVTEKISNCDLATDDMIIIAYGSAAVNQMSVGSDLDLVFVLDVDQLKPDAHTFAQKWVRRIIHHLITPMYHGKLYELDMQLRPNGNSGALVTTKKEFVNYQSNQAWIWEHAAMIKSKTIYATVKQDRWHRNLRAEIICQERNNSEVDQSLIEMAEKIQHKQSHKSHQAEFEFLSAVLKFAHQYQGSLDVERLNELQEQLIGAGQLETTLDLKTTIKKDPAR